MALVALAVVALGAVVERAGDPTRRRASLLIGWAVYQRLYGSRHRVRVGMRTGMAGLVLWSFLMATAHGAGLMLVPVLLPIERGASHAGHGGGPLAESHSLGLALGAVAVHTARSCSWSRGRSPWRSTSGSGSRSCAAAGSISTASGRLALVATGLLLLVTALH